MGFLVKSWDMSGVIESSSFFFLFFFLGGGGGHFWGSDSPT